jgi:hypothetical protein
MIYSIFHKEVKREKDDFEINYYLEINRKAVSVIYEFLSTYIYDYRKYTISLRYYVKNEYLILENIMRNIEKIYNNFAETRKLSIISKYTILVVSRILDIPVYKLIKSVQYESNGNITILSTNAFIKGVYRLQNRFEKLVS